MVTLLPLVAARSTDPDNVQTSASSAFQVAVPPGAALMIQPVKLVSKPGFLSKFPWLADGQVHAAAVGQHLPPQKLLEHSSGTLQTWPEDFFAPHEPPSQ